MKKILVTGGAGFIGTHLVKSLATNYEVTSCDIKEPSSCEASVKYVKQDCKEFLKIAKDNCHLAECQYDVIIHLAATPRIGVGLKEPGLVMQNNVNSLLAALEYCRQNTTTKLIFASSSSVIWADCSINPYAMSKKIGEQLVDMYNRTYGTSAVTVRLFNVYGPGEADYGADTTLIKQCKKCITSGTPITVFGDGSILRDFTHVDDIISGLNAVLDEVSYFTEFSDKFYDCVYELGFGEGQISVKQIVTTFARGNHPVEFKPGRTADAKTTCADKQKWPILWKPRIKVLNYIKEWIANGKHND